MSDAIKSRLEEIKSQATILSEAYRLRLVGRLWWANLLLVVLPAALATAAAISAFKNYPYLTAGLAGGAAVLTAIHKALKCEEYQAECLRLEGAYQSIAIKADSAISGQRDLLDDLTSEMASLSPKAPLQDKYLRKAEELAERPLKARHVKHLAEHS